MPTKVPDAQLIEALRKHRGNRARVAEEVGLSYDSVQRRVRRNKRLLAVALEAKEMLLDLAEENVRIGLEIEGIQLRNLKTLYERNPEAAVTVDAPSTRNTIFQLRTLGKTRGYTERNEVTGNDGESLQLVIKAPPQAKTADDWSKQFGGDDAPETLPH